MNQSQTRSKTGRNVRIAAVQMCCRVGDVTENISRAEKWIRRAADAGAVFLCLPELFTTGAADNVSELAEGIPGPTTEALGQMAQDNGVYLVAGMAERSDQEGTAYNTTVLIDPEGQLVCSYRKVFLYLVEKQVFTAGDRSCVVDLPFGKIGLSICYDYVFPEYVRHLVFQGIELLVHATAWLTTADCERWNYNQQSYRAMGMTRALENGIFFISANHSGPYDTAGALRGIGQSCIISPWGEILAEVTEAEGIAVADVDFDKPDGWRANIAPYMTDYQAGEKRLPFLPRY